MDMPGRTLLNALDGSGDPIQGLAALREIEGAVAEKGVDLNPELRESFEVWKRLLDRRLRIGASVGFREGRKATSVLREHIDLMDSMTLNRAQTKKTHPLVTHTTAGAVGWVVTQGLDMLRNDLFGPQPVPVLGRKLVDFLSMFGPIGVGAGWFAFTLTNVSNIKVHFHGVAFASEPPEKVLGYIRTPWEPKPRPYLPGESRSLVIPQEYVRPGEVTWMSLRACSYQRDDNRYGAMNPPCQAILGPNH